MAGISKEKNQIKNRSDSVWKFSLIERNLRWSHSIHFQNLSNFSRMFELTSSMFPNLFGCTSVGFLILWFDFQLWPIRCLCATFSPILSNPRPIFPFVISIEPCAFHPNVWPSVPNRGCLLRWYRIFDKTFHPKPMPNIENENGNFMKFVRNHLQWHVCENHSHHIDCGQFRRPLSWHPRVFRTPMRCLWRIERPFRFLAGQISAHHKPISLVSDLWCHADAASMVWLANNQAVRMFQLQAVALSESIWKFRENEMN